jgi:hypothetical protein
MAIPHFGEHQPGDTCYYTPTKLEGFGFADVFFVSEGGEEAEHLCLHCYGEGYGTKGAIDVASVIMKSLAYYTLLGILLSCFANTTV